MKKLLVVLSLLAAILALILSVLPLSNLAYIPALTALLLGVFSLIIKKGKANKKTLNLAFLLTIIALLFSVYKSVFSTTEVGNIEELKEKANQSVMESIETLESEIEVINEDTLEEEYPEDFSEKKAEDTITGKKQELEINLDEKAPSEEASLEEF